MKKHPTLAQINGRLIVDTENGRFIWRKCIQWNALAGQPAGNVDPYGYLVLSVCGMAIKAHRLCWFVAYGHWPLGVIDHINGDRSDNRIQNLRDSTQKGNRQNQLCARRDSSTGFQGVVPVGNRFKAVVKEQGRRHCFGSFLTPEQAHAAYVQGKRALHPEFAG